MESSNLKCVYCHLTLSNFYSSRFALIRIRSPISSFVVSAPAALFFLNYSLTSTTSITLTYSIDILNPIATEVISTIILIRGVLTFLMTLDSQNWIDHIGPGKLFTIYLFISLISLSPMFIFGIFKGRIIRHTTATN
ncbi:hypothetical protein H4Q26_013294 [Puccinia striiformis f. sp. tritici PST-130]|nr:hypothetical protein H4Q26_013294 [Puccinia striiformis f. sp. tritici PST-130]